MYEAEHLTAPLPALGQAAPVVVASRHFGLRTDGVRRGIVASSIGAPACFILSLDASRARAAHGGEVNVSGAATSGDLAAVVEGQIDTSRARV